MKAVIQTQTLENYAWLEDGTLGTGADAYWKAKGGDTYVVEMTIEQSMDAGFWDSIVECIEENSDMYQDYVLCSSLVDEIDFKESDHVEHWEAPIYATFDGAVLHCTKANRNFMTDEFEGYRTWERDSNGFIEVTEAA